MALPTQVEILTMDLAYKGKPFVWVSVSTEIDATMLDYSYNGKPVYAVSPAGGAPAYNATQFMIMF